MSVRLLINKYENLTINSKKSSIDRSIIDSIRQVRGKNTRGKISSVFPRNECETLITYNVVAEIETVKEEFEPEIIEEEEITVTQSSEFDELVVLLAELEAKLPEHSESTPTKYDYIKCGVFDYSYMYDDSDFFTISKPTPEKLSEIDEYILRELEKERNPGESITSDSSVSREETGLCGEETEQYSSAINSDHDELDQHPTTLELEAIKFLDFVKKNINYEEYVENKHSEEMMVFTADVRDILIKYLVNLDTDNHKDIDRYDNISQSINIPSEKSKLISNMFADDSCILEIRAFAMLLEDIWRNRLEYYNDPGIMKILSNISTGTMSYCDESQKKNIINKIFRRKSKKNVIKIPKIVYLCL